MARRRKRKSVKRYERIPLHVLEERLRMLETVVEKRRGASIGKTSFRTGKTACAADRAIGEVRKSARARRCSPSGVKRAEKLIASLPPRVAASRRRSLARASLGVDRACHEKKLARIPADPRRVVRVLEESIGDFGRVEPDEFPEYLSLYLPPSDTARLHLVRSTSQVPEGIAMLVRRARPRTWIDLESRPYRGAESVLAILRGFPGLEDLRLPDSAYSSAAALEWSPEGVPF